MTLKYEIYQNRFMIFTNKLKKITTQSENTFSLFVYFFSISCGFGHIYWSYP